MTEVWTHPAEHVGDFGDGLNFHLRTGSAAIAGVIIGIDGHRQRVGRPRERMRGLEHLSGIERMEVRVVVAQTMSGFIQNRLNFAQVGHLRKRGMKSWQGVEFALETLRRVRKGVTEQTQNWIDFHNDPLPYHSRWLPASR